MADVVNHGKCAKATSVGWLGNEAIYQTGRPGCLALTPLGFSLVKRGVLLRNQWGWDSATPLNTLEHQRSGEKHVKIS